MMIAPTTRARKINTASTIPNWRLPGLGSRCMQKPSAKGRVLGGHKLLYGAVRLDASQSATVRIYSDGGMLLMPPTIFRTLGVVVCHIDPNRKGEALRYRETQSAPNSCPCESGLPQRAGSSA